MFITALTHALQTLYSFAYSYSVLSPPLLLSKQTHTCPTCVMANKVKGAVLYGFTKARNSDLFQGHARSGRTHQVDRAADVAVHESHEAVHQIAGKERNAGSGAAWGSVQVPSRPTPPPGRKPNPKWKADVKTKSCK